MLANHLFKQKSYTEFINNYFKWTNFSTNLIPQSVMVTSQTGQSSYAEMPWTGITNLSNSIRRKLWPISRKFVTQNWPCWRMLKCSPMSIWVRLSTKRQSGGGRSRTLMPKNRLSVMNSEKPWQGSNRNTPILVLIFELKLHLFKLNSGEFKICHKNIN